MAIWDPEGLFSRTGIATAEGWTSVDVEAMSVGGVLADKGDSGWRASSLAGARSVYNELSDDCARVRESTHQKHDVFV